MGLHVFLRVTSCTACGSDNAVYDIKLSVHDVFGFPGVTFGYKVQPKM